MNPVELLMRRRNVQAFIKADSIQLVLTRKTPPVKTPAGGYVPGIDETLEPQVARIVHNTRRYKNGLVNTEPGDLPDTDYLLIGLHTLDVKVDDEFEWSDLQGTPGLYKITGIHPWRHESTLCSIQFTGPENRHG